MPRSPRKTPENTNGQVASGTTGLSRRRVLQTAATAAAGWTIVPRHVLGRGYQAPSDTVLVAGIGVGGRGFSDINGCAPHAEIVALADVDYQRAAPAFRRYPEAPRYRDFRDMLEKHPEIDAVTIGTPDHTHAYIAVTAMESGKHVYCEKPLTRTIHEARVLADVATKSGVATQMGNQGHAGAGTRQIREWIEAGVIGKVESVEFWTNRPIWPQAIERPTDLHHIPDTLSWDLWLGPAPERPFHPAYVPFRWRGWWDYGTGALGDIACHAMDASFWALDLREPTRIHAESTLLFEETAPASSRIVYEFPERNGRPALNATWRDGGLLPPRRPEFPADQPWPGGTSGQLIVGREGIIMADMYATAPRLYPESLAEEIAANPVDEKYPRTEGVYKEWIDACAGKGTAGSNFPDHATPLTEMCLLGNLALRSGQTIEWDSKKGMVANVKSANQWIKEPARKGWKLDALA